MPQSLALLRNDNHPETFRETVIPGRARPDVGIRFLLLIF